MGVINHYYPSSDKVHIWYYQSLWGGNEIFWGDAKGILPKNLLGGFNFAGGMHSGNLPYKVYTTQMTTINGHLSPQLLHKMPIASFAILHTSHVDAFMLCFNCNYKRANIKWCICLSFLAEKPSYYTAYHFSLEVNVGVPPF